MRDKLFHSVSQVWLEEVLLNWVECVWKSGDVFNQDVVASNHHFSLLLTRLCTLRGLGHGLVLLWWLGFSSLRPWVVESLARISRISSWPGGFFRMYTCETCSLLRTISILLRQRTLLLFDKSVSFLCRRLTSSSKRACCLLVLARSVVHWILLHHQFLVWLWISDWAGTRARVKSVLRVSIFGWVNGLLGQQSWGLWRYTLSTFLTRCSLVRNNFTRVEYLVQDLVERLVSCKVLVIELGVTSGENPTKILHSAKLVDGLCDKISKSELHRSLKAVNNVFVLSLVLLDQLVDQKLNLGVRVEVWNQDLVSPSLWYRDWPSELVISHVGFSFALGSSCLLKVGVFVAVL